MCKPNCEPSLTREKILEAALSIFCRQGVSQSSLEEIAREAGFTRGALYGHFSSKKELLHSLTIGAFEPMCCALEKILETSNQANPLDAIEEYLYALSRFLIGPSREHQLYELLLTRCEQIDQSPSIRSEMMKPFEGFYDKIVAAYQKAENVGRLTKDVDATCAAQDTFVFLHSLLRLPFTLTAGNVAIKYTHLIKGHMALRRRED